MFEVRTLDILLDSILAYGGEGAEAVNHILSNLIMQCPIGAQLFASYMSFPTKLSIYWWGDCPIRHANNDTFEILKHYAEDGYIQYRLMARSTEITDWQQYVDEGVDSTVLNWMLLDAVNKNLSTNHLEFLVSNGVDVNSYRYNYASYKWRLDIPLTLGVGRGNMDSIRFLYALGADILPDTNQSMCDFVSVSDDCSPQHICDFVSASDDCSPPDHASKAVTASGHLEVAEMMEKLEKEELDEKNIRSLPATSKLACTVQTASTNYMQHMDLGQGNNP